MYEEAEDDGRDQGRRERRERTEWQGREEDIKAKVMDIITTAFCDIKTVGNVGVRRHPGKEIKDKRYGTKEDWHMTW